MVIGSCAIFVGVALPLLGYVIALLGAWSGDHGYGKGTIGAVLVRDGTGALSGFGAHDGRAGEMEKARISKQNKDKRGVCAPELIKRLRVGKKHRCGGGQVGGYSRRRLGQAIRRARPGWQGHDVLKWPRAAQEGEWASGRRDADEAEASGAVVASGRRTANGVACTGY